MADIGRTVTYKLECLWDRVSFTDETENFISASGERRVAAPGSAILSPRGQVQSMRLTLFNKDGRFSPFRTDGPLYPYIKDGEGYHVAVRFQVSIDGGALQPVFIGLMKMPVETGGTYRGVDTVTIDCRGMEERFAQQRNSTGLVFSSARWDNGVTESDIIEAWLTLANVDPLEMLLDTGLHVIPASWLDDESPLADIWDLAAAAGGWFYTNRFGQYVYKNATYLSSSTSSGTLGVGDYASVRVRYDDRDLFSDIVVEASPRELTGETVLWEPDEIPSAAPGETKTITALLRQPAYAIDTVTYDAVTSGGTDISSDVSVVLTKNTQRVEIAITNNNATHAVNLRNMQLIGQSIDGSPSLEESTTSTDPYWSANLREKRSRRLRGNPYIQSRRQAAFLAAMLIDFTESPRATISITSEQGDPTQELLDRITVSNANVFTTDIDIIITRMTFTADRSGFNRDLEGIEADAFFLYSDTTPGYFVLGTNRLGTGTDSGRLFY